MPGLHSCRCKGCRFILNVLHFHTMSTTMASVGVIVDDGTGDDSGTTRQQQHPTTPTILIFLVHFMDAVMVSDTSCWELMIVEYSTR